MVNTKLTLCLKQSVFVFSFNLFLYPTHSIINKNETALRVECRNNRAPEKVQIFLGRGGVTVRSCDIFQ